MKLPEFIDEIQKLILQFEEDNKVIITDIVDSGDVFDYADGLSKRNSINISVNMKIGIINELHNDLIKQIKNPERGTNL